MGVLAALKPRSDSYLLTSWNLVMAVAEPVWSCDCGLGMAHTYRALTVYQVPRAKLNLAVAHGK